MSKWQVMAGLLNRLAAAAEGNEGYEDAGVTLSAREARIIRNRRECSDLVSSPAEVPSTSKRGRAHWSCRLDDRGRELDPVLVALFGREMGAPRLTIRIVAALQQGSDPRRDGQVSAGALATILGVRPARMRRHLGRLEQAGLVESFDWSGDDPDEPESAYRLRLRWASDAPNLNVCAPRGLLDQCVRTEVAHDFSFYGDSPQLLRIAWRPRGRRRPVVTPESCRGVEITWRQDGLMVATAFFTESSAVLQIRHGGIAAELYGDHARAAARLRQARTPRTGRGRAP